MKMEEQINIFSAILFVKKFLLISGHWPNKTPTLSMEFRSLFFLILAVTFFITNLLEIVSHFSNFKDLAENLSVTSPVFTFILKISVFKIKKKEILGLLDLVKNAKTFQTREYRYMKFVKIMNDNCILLTKIYGGICSVVIIFYAVLSLRSENILPIKFTHDFGSWIYGMYIFQMSAIASVCFSTVCLDTFVVCFMGIATAQLEMLEQKVLNTFKEKEEARLCLNDCVVHHAEIIEYFSNMENIFTFFFLAQYLGSILSICNIGFQLANVQPGSVEFVNMVCFFSAMTWQLATFCWFGNEIIIKSLAISDACYKTAWQESDNETRKSLITIMIRANNKLAMTAGKFSTLSLESLTSIMKASYSYFALMQGLYQDEIN